MDKVVMPDYVPNFGQGAVFIGDRIDINEVSKNWSEIVARAIDDEHTILSKDGEDVAAVISIEAYYFLLRAIALIKSSGVA
jgi:hypothetical protein